VSDESLQNRPAHRDSPVARLVEVSSADLLHQSAPGAGEHGFGRALQGIACIEIKRLSRIGFSDMVDDGRHTRKASFHAAGGVAANIVPGHEVAVDVPE